MIASESELRQELAMHWNDGEGSLRVLPRDGLDGADGCIVVDTRSTMVTVYLLERGKQGLREFATEAEAYDYAHRRWVLWDQSA